MNAEVLNNWWGENGDSSRPALGSNSSSSMVSIDRTLTDTHTRILVLFSHKIGELLGLKNLMPTRPNKNVTTHEKCHIRNSGGLVTLFHNECPQRKKSADAKRFITVTFFPTPHDSFVMRAMDRR